MMISASAHAEAFSGPFVGIDIGHDTAKLANSYSWYDIDSTNDNYREWSESSFNMSGISGGVYAGYDTKINSKLFAGVEVRANLSSAKYKTHEHRVNENSAVDRHIDSSVRAKESFSATARIGYMINDNTGLYLRGGVIQTRFKAQDQDGYSVAYDPNTDEFDYAYSATDRNIGALYGAGLESKVSDSLSVRIEYNVMAFGSAFDKLNEQFSAAESAYYDDKTIYKNTLKTHQVRLGVSRSF